MKILILGDCASAGTNILAPEIIGEQGITIEYSLANSMNKKYAQKINNWYLKKTDSQKEKIKSFLYKQELANSYWKFINVQVDNRSKNGATAGGYFKRLTKYEQEHNSKPDVIFVTDHDLAHKWQVINYKNQKYFLEKNYDKRQPFMYNESLTAPENVQRIAWNRAKHAYENKSVAKRNKKIMTWFINYLSKNNYTYYKIKFYGGFDEFDYDTDVLDCSDLVKKYTIANDDGTRRGDKVDIKIDVAPKIAQRIKEKHKWLTKNQI